MTEAELIEVATSNYGLGIETLNLYLTVTSGYLIVAFFIGARLTIYQLVIISTLYVFTAGYVMRLGFIFWNRGLAFTVLHAATESGTGVHGSPVDIVVVTVFLAGGIFASLGFMWRVRHPKTE